MPNFELVTWSPIVPSSSHNISKTVELVTNNISSLLELVTLVIGLEILKGMGGASHNLRKVPNLVTFRGCA